MAGVGRFFARKRRGSSVAPRSPGAFRTPALTLSLSTSDLRRVFSQSFDRPDDIRSGQHHQTNVASVSSSPSAASLPGAFPWPSGTNTQTVHCKSPSITSISSVPESEVWESPGIDSEEMLALTREVQHFSDALGKLRNFFISAGQGELSRVSSHQRLSEVLWLLKVVINKYPSLAIEEILPSTGVLISRVKGYPEDEAKDTEDLRADVLQAVDGLALAFSNSVAEYLMGEVDCCLLSTQATPQSRSLEDLHKNDEYASQLRPYGEIPSAEPPSSSPGYNGLISPVSPSGGCVADCPFSDGASETFADGVEAILAYNKALSKYTKELATFVDKRLTIEMEYAKSMMKLSQTHLHTFSQDPPMPLQNVYMLGAERETSAAHALLQTVNSLNSHAFLQPLTSFRDDHDRKRKELKDLWQKEQRKLHDAEGNLRKAQHACGHRQTDLEKARCLAARAEAIHAPTSAPRTLDRRRKAEEEAALKAEEAERLLRICGQEARVCREGAEAARMAAMVQGHELANRAELLLRTVTANYFELLHRQVANRPESYHSLADSCGLFDAGNHYQIYARALGLSDDLMLPLSPKLLIHGFSGKQYGDATTPSTPTTPLSPPNPGQTSIKSNEHGAVSRTWSHGGAMCSDTESGSGSSESRSLDSPSTSPGDFMRKLPRTPSTGTMSSTDDLDEREPLVTYEQESRGVQSGTGHTPDVASPKPIAPLSLSPAARTHRLRRLRGAARCRGCDGYVRLHGAECQECSMACHKKCLKVLSAPCVSRCLRSHARLFGQPLRRASRGTPGGVPFVIRACVAEVEQRAMALKGIYRVNGVKSRVEHLCQVLENKQDSSLLTEATPHDVGNVLKLYLRQLPEPVVCFSLYNDFIQFANEWRPHSGELQEVACSSPDENMTKGVEKEHLVTKLQGLLGNLPGPHQTTLCFLLAHLYKVSQLEKENKMSASNLGIVFGPTLMRPQPSETPDSLASLADYPRQAQIIALFISNWPALYLSESPAEDQHHKQPVDAEDLGIEVSLSANRLPSGEGCQWNICRRESEKPQHTSTTCGYVPWQVQSSSIESGESKNVGKMEQIGESKPRVLKPSEALLKGKDQMTEKDTGANDIIDVMDNPSKKPVRGSRLKRNRMVITRKTVTLGHGEFFPKDCHGGLQRPLLSPSTQTSAPAEATNSAFSKDKSQTPPGSTSYPSSANNCEMDDNHEVLKQIVPPHVFTLPSPCIAFKQQRSYSLDASTSMNFCIAPESAASHLADHWNDGKLTRQENISHSITDDFMCERQVKSNNSPVQNETKNSEYQSCKTHQKIKARTGSLDSLLHKAHSGCSNAAKNIGIGNVDTSYSNTKGTIPQLVSESKGARTVAHNPGWVNELEQELPCPGDVKKQVPKNIDVHYLGSGESETTRQMLTWLHPHQTEANLTLQGVLDGMEAEFV
uniref:rho GTPase-activating protein 45-like isoform X2 n=1 Tax=Myxine glutinosa TaxID=7769 RepID=UPI00358DE1A6